MVVNGHLLAHLILRDLCNFCQWPGKWKEVSYIQPFSYLHSKSSPCFSCSPTQLLLTIKSQWDEPSTILNPAHDPHPVLTIPTGFFSLLFSPDFSASSPCLASPDFTPSSPATGHSNCFTLAPTFTPPIAFCPSTICYYSVTNPPTHTYTLILTKPLWFSFCKKSLHWEIWMILSSNLSLRNSGKCGSRLKHM